MPPNERSSPCLNDVYPLRTGGRLLAIVVDFTETLMLTDFGIADKIPYCGFFDEAHGTKVMDSDGRCEI